ncbi:MAG: universal stress protein [Actinomycetota bacterium]
MYKRIVVGVDGSPTARAALAQAIALAKELGALLHVVTAYRSGAQVTALAVDPVGAVVGAGAAIAEEDLRGEADAILAEAAGEATAAGVGVETSALAEDASEAILDTAERIDADLIIVGNRGMTGAKRLLGSVPNRVAHHAACSVMIVHTA